MNQTHYPNLILSLNQGILKTLSETQNTKVRPPASNCRTRLSPNMRYKLCDTFLPCPAYLCRTVQRATRLKSELRLTCLLRVSPVAPSISPLLHCCSPALQFAVLLMQAAYCCSCLSSVLRSAQSFLVDEIQRLTIELMKAQGMISGLTASQSSVGHGDGCLHPLPVTLNSIGTPTELPFHPQSSVVHDESCQHQHPLPVTLSSTATQTELPFHPPSVAPIELRCPVPPPSSGSTLDGAQSMI
ncbi:hypothetical protein J6590_091555 [Homalodisca vitripennis]|nr:hypothetical protein J6590_091555 [Homalodisca vitripennis]